MQQGMTCTRCLPFGIEPKLLAYVTPHNYDFLLLEVSIIDALTTDSTPARHVMTKASN